MKLLIKVLRRPLGAISIVVLLMLTIVALFTGWVIPVALDAGSLQAILASPGVEHPLGADSAGRDVLSRLLVATRVTLAAATVAVLTALVIGVGAGLIAGYFRGWFDGIASWMTTLVMAMPGIIVLLAARSILGPSVWTAMLIFGVLLSPAYYRLVYASVTAVREELYVDAARVSGLSDARIIRRHVLSAVRGPILIQSSIVAGVAIAVQSGLEFLGLGDLAVPTWGSMLNDGFANMYRQPLLLLWPALMIALSCVALALLANTLRDVLERSTPPRRRGPRVVTTSTGSIASVTSSLALSGADLPDPAEAIDATHPAVEHPDDEHSRHHTGDPVLRVRGLRVSYEQEDGDGIEVVHGIDLDVRPGEVHGLVGESGSGKSQTAFAILGLLSRGGRIDGGSIQFEGNDLTKASERTLESIRGGRIGYIPQEPMTNLDPSFTVGAQLVEPMRKHLRVSRKEARSRAIALLARVGIPDPERTFRAYPFEISGGMAQRVLIAGAVCTDPVLLIADEPTTALDVTVQAEILDLLRDLQRERGMSLLVVTHNLGVVADLCDRVTVMRDGRFVETGPVRAIIRSPRHLYTRALCAASLEGAPARAPLGAVHSSTAH
ncbi:peptide/nickel transport system permease protein [Microbacterium sp. ZKA21]|uniref:ATP-binding cassette domain-containing protein n=1 Tax=Microbacterium sp. ZKA21 TaxID=3381694 RepID=UPI003D1C86D3